jgi:hypothetical protein
MTKEETPMSSSLFVESHDPFESRDVEEGYRLMTALAAKPIPVTLFLVQNGVLAARQGARAAQFTALVAHPGVTENAGNYAVCGQQPQPLSFGTASLPFPPRLDQALRKAIQAGVKLVLLRDDAELRGIPASALMSEAERISREQLAVFLLGNVRQNRDGGHPSVCGGD